MERFRMVRPGARARLASIAALGVVMIGGATAAVAADPFRAGQRATRETALGETARSAVVARADGLVRALGIDPVVDRIDPLHVRAEARLPGEVERDVHAQAAGPAEAWAAAAAPAPSGHNAR